MMADPFRNHIDGMNMSAPVPRQVTVYPVYFQPQFNRRVIIGMVLGALAGMAARKLIEHVVREWKVKR